MHAGQSALALPGVPAYFQGLPPNSAVSSTPYKSPSDTIQSLIDARNAINIKLTQFASYCAVEVTNIDSLLDRVALR